MRRSIRRRQVLGLIGGATACPLAARAQQASGTLRLGTVALAQRSAPIWVAFEQRLAEPGYEEARNFAFEFIQIPSLEGYEAGFRELVARKVDIIFHGGGGARTEMGAQSHDHAADRDSGHRL